MTIPCGSAAPILSVSSETMQLFHKVIAAIR